MASRDISVPDGASPAGRCAYCDRPFPTAERLALHKGQAHANSLSAEEESAVEQAEAAEEAAVKQLRLKATMTVILVYFGLLFLYAIVT